MGSIEKFLRKLPFEKRQVAKEVLIKILSKRITGLDIKKLKGYKNLFRVRKGNLRVVFSQEGKELNIIFIGQRGDSKYKQF